MKIKKKLSKSISIGKNMNITLITAKRSLDEVAALLNSKEFSIKTGKK